MAACCRCFLKYCRKQKATSLLLEHLAVPRNAPSGKRTILQPNDLSLLFSRNTTIYNREEKYEPFVYAFRFQVLTGVRPGELLGLKWNDIDFVRRLITLERSINSHREFTTGKNCNAQRSFCMTDDCYHLILKHEQINGRESEYVFSLNGKFIRPGTYYDRWIKYRDYHQICHASPYELRHTFISIIKALPLGLIKPLVGHSINMDTYRVYGHELEGEKQKTAVLVQQQFHKVANFSAEHSSEEDLPGYSDQ